MTLPKTKLSTSIFFLITITLVIITYFKITSIRKYIDKPENTYNHKQVESYYPDICEFSNDENLVFCKKVEEDTYLGRQTYRKVYKQPAESNIAFVDELEYWKAVDESTWVSTSGKYRYSCKWGHGLPIWNTEGCR